VLVIEGTKPNNVQLTFVNIRESLPLMGLARAAAHSSESSSYCKPPTPGITCVTNAAALGFLSVTMAEDLEIDFDFAGGTSLFRLNDISFRVVVRKLDAV
jgi:hypothetical protein